MKFTLDPSLQQMALVQTASQLWNQKNIRKVILNIGCSDSYPCIVSQWEELEVQVLESVSQLPLPSLLKRDLTSIIGPVGDQMREWFASHKEKCQLVRLPTQLIWTPEGTIDRKRTSEMLIKNEDLDIKLRYELACINCLKDQILELWNRLPQQQRSNFPTQLSNAHVLVKYWTYQITGETSDLENLITSEMGECYPLRVYGFHCAIEDGNLAAAKFFLCKLSEEERVTLTVDYAKRVRERRCNDEQPQGNYTEVFLFLLSQLSDDHQREILAELPYHKLCCFLDYPFQPFFMVLAQHTMHLFTESDHVHILDLITRKIAQGYTDFDYHQLFRDYWNLIPLCSKRISNVHYGLLATMFFFGEEGLLKFVLEDADVVGKERFVLSVGGRALCLLLICEGKSSSLKLLFDQCVSSKEVMVQFKEDLIQDGWNEECRLKFDAVIRIADDLIDKKRKAKDDGDNPCKKLRT